MKKYLHVVNIGIQNQLVYRTNFFFRAAFGLIPLTATLMLWRAIYEGNDGGEVAGYGLAQMVSYYLIITIVDALTAVNEDDWQIAADIKDGNISQFLLKPIDYLAYRFCLFVTGRAIYTVVAIVPVGLFILYLNRYLVAPASVEAAMVFGASVILTALLQFFISYTMALLAFWVLEVATLIFVLFAFEYIAGGHLFPLDILPPAIQSILEFTPFPYLLYFPVSVYLGRVEGDAMWTGLATQAGWVVGAFLLARFVWSRGIKKYSAVGG
ncbi:MAG TPA: hypothetical protein DCY13_10705 [Verrucomicrobiales bacterium]|nr:hypothetical protein [Verrucomicrobiales bacterium]